ncbi:protein SOSEKI 5-like [Impatiens glandulifera]|uniref:protein SOSEKI 5-like n=1 Tax=Impatiens glandulifera TaxID=253017 RepID=UPI001FB0BA05|nr:protein SOSEKI 5-like [Impatiens glandulifera]
MGLTQFDELFVLNQKRYPKAKPMRSFDEDEDCRNQSWRSIDDSGCEYRVYKTDSMNTEGSKGLDAATQTSDGDGDGKKVLNNDMGMEMEMEMNRDEISPPLSSSRTSLESWDSVSEGRKMEMEMRSGRDIRDRGNGNGQLSGRMKASVVLKQLVSCGSVSVMESALLKSKGASMVSGKSGLGEESVCRRTKDSGN